MAHRSGSINDYGVGAAWCFGKPAAGKKSLGGRRGGRRCSVGWAWEWSLDLTDWTQTVSSAEDAPAYPETLPSITTLGLPAWHRHEHAVLVSELFGSGAW